MAKINVKLYADANLKENVKYRTGGPRGTPLWEKDTHSIGNFANKNIHSANSIEISAPFTVCGLANYIVLNFDGTVIIAGEITDINYINDNNSQVSYVVDYFTSANMTNAIKPGYLASAYGFCERTNLGYTDSHSYVNLLPEPFAGNDTTRSAPKMTREINAELNTFLGVTQSDANVLENGYVFVLWISGFLRECAAARGRTDVQAWAIDCLPFGNFDQVITVNSFSDRTGPDATTLWSGGYSKGIPLVFRFERTLNNFINAALSGMGLRVIIPPDGLNNDGVIRRYVDVTSQQYFLPEIMTDYEAESMADVEMEQVRLITDEDIYNIQIIPEKIALTGGINPETYEAHMPMPHTLANFHGLGNELDAGFTHSKAMTYPYYYFKIVTRVGNVFELFPQVYVQRSNVFASQLEYHLVFRFIGGERPKAQMRIALSLQETLDWTSYINNVEWINIYEFPSVAWATNVSSVQQTSQLSARFKRRGDVQKALIGSAVSGTGFMHGLRGGQSVPGEQSVLQTIGTFLGNASQGAANAAANFITGGNGGMQKNSLLNDVNQNTALQNAGNIITSGNETFLSDDDVEQLLSPGLQVFMCGFSNAECSTLCRFFDRLGQSVNCNINPLNNSGAIFGGRAFVSSFDGKTFYKFTNLDVVGALPTFYKSAIENMFISGVYLIN